LAQCTTGDAAGSSLPRGFVTSAHVVHSDLFVQVTGAIDAAAAGWKATDRNIFYDEFTVSLSGSCAGYPHYIQLLSSTTNTFCLRCCATAEACNLSDSSECPSLVPGEY
ncbi:hypothetical protein BC831DRAFT_378390, partial [Entophlyctis helioformis]